MFEQILSEMREAARAKRVYLSEHARDEMADEEDKTIVEQGPSIGEYRRESIPEYIVDSSGVRFEFDRIALEGDGGLEPSQLARNECLIAPGLIYRKVSS